MNASKSELIWSALVVGMPCGSAIDLECCVLQKFAKGAAATIANLIVVACITRTGTVIFPGSVKSVWERRRCRRSGPWRLIMPGAQFQITPERFRTRSIVTVKTVQPAHRNRTALGWRRAAPVTINAFWVARRIGRVFTIKGGNALMMPLCHSAFAWRAR